MHQKEQKRESRGVSASVLERDRGKKKRRGGGGGSCKSAARALASRRRGANGPRGDGARFDTIRSLARGEARRHGGKERRPCRCLKLDRAIHSLLPSPSASPPRSRAETVRPREPLQCRANISAAHSLVVWRAALTFRSLPGVALVAALRFPYASAALAFVSLRRPPDGRRAPFSPPRVEIPS